MAYSETPSVSTGDLWTAANQNTYLRDNLIDHETRILAVEAGGSSYQFIQEVPVTGATAATIEFSDIVSTYRHLRIIGLLRGNYAGVQVSANITFNSDGGANYDYREITSVAAASTVATVEANGATKIFSGYMTGANATASMPGVLEIDIPYYKQTTWHKEVIIKSGSKADNSTPTTSMTIRFIIGYWRNTSAITTVTITPGSGSWVTGSSLCLYGIE
jgi:hypothetical protein